MENGETEGVRNCESNPGWDFFQKCAVKHLESAKNPLKKIVLPVRPPGCDSRGLQILSEPHFQKLCVPANSLIFPPLLSPTAPPPHTKMASMTASEPALETFAGILRPSTGEGKLAGVEMVDAKSIFTSLQRNLCIAHDDVVVFTHSVSNGFIKDTIRNINKKNEKWGNPIKKVAVFEISCPPADNDALQRRLKTVAELFIGNENWAIGIFSPPGVCLPGNVKGTLLRAGIPEGQYVLAEDTAAAKAKAPAKGKAAAKRKHDDDAPAVAVIKAAKTAKTAKTSTPAAKPTAKKGKKTVLTGTEGIEEMDLSDVRRFLKTVEGKRCYGEYIPDTLLTEVRHILKSKACYSDDLLRCIGFVSAGKQPAPETVPVLAPAPVAVVAAAETSTTADPPATAEDMEVSLAMESDVEAEASAGNSTQQSSPADTPASSRASSPLPEKEAPSSTGKSKTATTLPILHA